MFAQRVSTPPHEEMNSDATPDMIPERLCFFGANDAASE